MELVTWADQWQSSMLIKNSTDYIAIVEPLYMYMGTPEINKDTSLINQDTAVGPSCLYIKLSLKCGHLTHQDTFGYPEVVHNREVLL